MAGSLPPISDYYKFVVSATDPGGGTFTVPLGICRLDAFTGDGSEFGEGALNGKRQLRHLLDKVCEGLQRNGWGNVTVTGPVEANTTTKIPITLPAPD
jgi:hypothetical protein